MTKKKLKTASLEEDLNTSDDASFIIDKIRSKDVYAQNFYAALCNNVFLKKDSMWSCTWRYAGGMIAFLRESGDYMDWYCSGMRGDSDTPYNDDYVSESVITEEIKKDLKKIGWKVQNSIAS